MPRVRSDQIHRDPERGATAPPVVQKGRKHKHAAAAADIVVAAAAAAVEAWHGDKVVEEGVEVRPAGIALLLFTIETCTENNDMKCYEYFVIGHATATESENHFYN